MPNSYGKPRAGPQSSHIHVRGGWGEEMEAVFVIYTCSQGCQCGQEQVLPAGNHGGDLTPFSIWVALGRGAQAHAWPGRPGNLPGAPRAQAQGKEQQGRGESQAREAEQLHGA
jgi:hypothetical protein